MAGSEEVWLPLVDEPIGAIVTEIEAEHPEITELVDSLETLLAFRTFAYIRVGIVLGRLLVENEVEAYDGSETWVDVLLRDPAHREEIVREVRQVAEELASGERVEEAPVPDEAARERFRSFARRTLGRSE